MFGDKLKYFHPHGYSLVHIDVPSPRPTSLVWDVNPYNEGEILLKASAEGCPKQDDWALENQQTPEYQEIINSQEIQDLAKAIQAETGVDDEITFEDLKNIVDMHMSLKENGEPSLAVFDDPSYAKTGGTAGGT